MSDSPYIAFSHGNNNTIELGNADNSGEAGQVILFDEGNNTQAIITIDDGQLHVDGETIEYFLRQLITQNTGRGPNDGDVIAFRASTNNLIWSAVYLTGATYLRPDGSSSYLRPDGVSNYLRP
jgi:hypothetical protein